jgi:hypothetical protein
MRTLPDSTDTSKLIGLLGRVLIALMGFTFARIGAVITVKVEDYLHPEEKGLGAAA